MTAYRRGVAREKQVCEVLRADGYFVLDSRGSHGPADLVAVKLGQVLLVQVKGGTLRDGAAHLDRDHNGWNTLYEIACDVGALAILAEWPVNVPLTMWWICGAHAKNSLIWPAEPFTTDEIARPVRKGAPQ